MFATMDIWTAAEARSLAAPIVRLFVTGLSRPPTRNELAEWVGQMRAGDDLGHAAQAVVAGAEFEARHGPSRTPTSLYVHALYWAIDGLAPGDGETAGLLAQPNATRASLLAQVSQSARAQAAITLERTVYANRLDPRDDVAYQLWLDGGGEHGARHDGPIPEIPISIVLLADPARPDRLQRSLASLAAQSSPAWEAVVVTAGPAAAPGRAARIRTVPNVGVSRGDAWNTGARQAAGDLVGFIDAGDRLAPTAVEDAARAAAACPGVRVIYTDEDHMAEDGTRSGVVLKGGWSPELLLSGDALGQLALFRRQAVLDAGGLCADAGAFALLDLALRLTHDATPGLVAHVPGILFHRGATAGPSRFPRYRASNGVTSLDAVVDRFLATHRPALTRVARREGSRIWPAFRAALPDPAPTVSVIVPTKDRAELLRDCLDGLLRVTSYPAMEVLVVDNGSTDADTLDLLAAMSGDPRVRLLRYPGQFNWSAMNNMAAAEAAGEVLLLLNNDISGMDAGWLSTMVGHAMRPEAGVVGARLLYPDDPARQGRLQHGGVLLGPAGTAAHAMAGAARDDPGYLGQAALQRDLSAVTGACLAIRRAVFREVGGLEQDHLKIAWSDIDLCLRVKAAGYRVLWTPDVTLVHREVATRGPDVTLGQQVRREAERAYTRRRWPGVTDHDPYLNPALTAGPGAMLLRIRAGGDAAGLPGGPEAGADRIEQELQLRCLTLERTLAEANAHVDNLRAAWPWAELQRSHAALADAQARLDFPRGRADLHPGFVELALVLQRRARQLRSAWRLVRRLAGIIAQTPRRAALLRQRRADYAVLAASPLFDRAWYRASAMDGHAAGDPVSHYLWRGAAEGSPPHALFDGAWYSSRTPGLGLENPFAHYLRRGMAANADPHPLFDTAYYLTQAPEATGQALGHYGTLPARTTLSPSPLFDAIDNPQGLAAWSVADANADRDPHALFATAWYRRTHLGADPAATPLAHWMRTGSAAGLPPNPYGLGSAWRPMLSGRSEAPSATVVVRHGRCAVDTSRTLISVIRGQTELPFRLLVAGAGSAPPRHPDIGVAGDGPAAIRASQGRYLVFLGGGVVAHEGWFDALVETADADPGAGLVGPKTLDGHGRLRSVGATLHDDGVIQHGGAGDDPSLPRHRFTRSADALEGGAMLVRRTAWDTISPFDIDYGHDGLNAAALGLALRNAGWRVVVQPASVVTIPGASIEPPQSETARFVERWASQLSTQPPAGERNPAWRAAARRVLVLADTLPSPAGGTPAADALHALLGPGTRVVLHVEEPPIGLADVAAWERLGVELLRPPVVFAEWLKEFGPYLDETLSFRTPIRPPNAARQT